MKLPCNVIEDLLPLYHDSVCSRESRVLVEEHIEECKTCRAMLNALSEKTEVSHIDDAAALKSIQKEWNTVQAKFYRKGIVLACTICLCLSFLFYSLTQFRVVSVPANVLEVTDVSQLEDGSIAFHLYVNDSKTLRQIDLSVTEDGALYFTPKHAVLEAPRKADVGMFDQDHFVSIAYQEDFRKMDITSLYIGPVGRGILIWEEGMELPPASQKMQEALGIQSSLFTDALKAQTG